MEDTQFNNNQTNPIISVLLPVFNAENFIYEAVRSILAQSFTNFELIVINDGSSDGTKIILEGLREQDQRVILISRENKGLVESLNEGIDHARGKWIARMDADDIALPQRFERQLKYLEQTGADVCGSWMRYFGAGDQRIWKTFQTDEAIKMDMLFKCPLAHPTVIVRAKLIKNLRYDKAWEKAEDYELWTRAAMAGWKMANIQEVLLLYRRHKEQISTSTFSKQMSLTMEVQKKYWIFMSEALGLDKEELENIPFLVHSYEKSNVNQLDLMVEKLLRQSSGEAKSAISQGVTRICYKCAADHPDVVARLSKLIEKFGVGFSLRTKIQLVFVRFLKIRVGGRLYRLARLYRFLLGS